MSSQYTVIDGVEYEKVLLDLAEKLTAGVGDGRISKADAAELFEAIKADNLYSEDERRTIAYIKANYKWTGAALKSFDEALGEWLATTEGAAINQELIKLADELTAGVGDGRISKDDAAKLLAAIQDDNLYTEDERLAVAHIKANYKWTAAALKSFDEALGTWLATTEGTAINQELIKLADELTTGVGDGRISKDDATKLLAAIQDDNLYTEDERLAVAHIKANYKWTAAALKSFDEALSTWLATTEGTGINLELLKLADELTTGVGDGRISKDDATKLLAVIQEDGLYTEDERLAVAHIKANYKWTAAALNSFDEALSTWLATTEGTAINQELIKLADELTASVGDGRISKDDATKLLAVIQEDGLYTEDERLAITHIKANYKWTDAALKSFDEALSAWLASTEGATINQELIKMADELTAGVGDGRISKDDAAQLLAAIQEDGLYTEDERLAITHIKANYKWTDAALKSFDEALESWLASIG